MSNGCGSARPLNADLQDLAGYKITGVNDEFDGRVPAQRSVKLGPRAGDPPEALVIEEVPDRTDSWVTVRTDRCKSGNEWLIQETLELEAGTHVPPAMLHPRHTGARYRTSPDKARVPEPKHTRLGDLDDAWSHKSFDQTDH